MTQNEPATQGLTRRELLKRGAVVGGALVWATPVVQLIGMTPALASHVSDICFCLKNDPPGSENFVALTHSSGECLSPTDQNCEDPPPTIDPEFLSEFSVTPISGGYTIQFPANCTLVAVSTKCGGGAPNNDCDAVACTCDLAPETYSCNGSQCYDVFDDECEAGSISHIEFCIQC